MGWDWKKALGPEANVATPDGAPRAASKPAAGLVPTVATASGGSRRASIAWRPGSAGGVEVSSRGVVLVMEPEQVCPFCHGRGEVAAGSVCPVCNGSGKTHVEVPAVRCAFCAGQGQMPPRSNLTCWVCKGKGLIFVRPPVEVCPDCQGRGRRPCESLYCPRCKGVGVVSSLTSGTFRKGRSL